MSWDSDGVSPVSPVTRQFPQQASTLGSEEVNSSLQEVYFPEDEAGRVTLSKHLEEVANRFGNQQAQGADFRHSEVFFHRFMRAAPEKALHPEDFKPSDKKSNQAAPSRPWAGSRLAKTNSNTASLKLQNANTEVGQSRLKYLEKSSKNLPTKMARQLGYERRVPAFAKRYLFNNPMTRLSFRTFTPMAPKVQSMLLPSSYYGTFSYRKSFEKWLKLPYNAKHFDHRTTFFPVELLPPPDVDFIPFELYASLSVMVGWQWLVDECVRQEFVSGRHESDNLEIFLANYSLLGIKPADSIQGAIAHYPSEEQQQRMLQYLGMRSRAKARMRIELLNRQGDTVADTWIEYDILRKKKKKGR